MDCRVRRPGPAPGSACRHLRYAGRFDQRGCRSTNAGALVRRGAALALVSATGTRTRFGRTAELVRTTHGVSTQQTTVLRVVCNLAIFNRGVIVALVAYATALGLPTHEVISLTLTAILAAIPVALPATCTLASYRRACPTWRTRPRWTCSVRKGPAPSHRMPGR
ncbi:MAG: hypothetical protein ACP5P4_06660 [Steroidobacteraceae bacterium]